MILNIKRSELVDPLKNIVGVSEQKQTMPILGHVLLEFKGGYCSLTSTDLEVQVSYTAATDVKDDVRITVPARKFSDILKSLDSPVIELEVNPHDVVIKSNKSRFKVATLDPDDLPVTDNESNTWIKINPNTLLKLINSTSFSMGYQDARHFLNGLYMEFDPERIIAVATDGHRLAFSTDQCSLTDTSKSCIIPRKCIVELRKILLSFSSISDILTEVNVNSKNISFKINDYLLLSKLVEGNYPDYNKVFPGSLPNTLKMNKGLLKTSLQRLSILSSEQFKGVKFKITDGNVNLSTINSQQESGNESIECNYNGEDLEIGFNLSYLLETLDVIDTEHIIINLGGSDMGCLVTADGDESSKYIIMPMRV